MHVKFSLCNKPICMLYNLYDLWLCQCLTLPSHYPKRCRLIINKVLWQSLEGNCTGNDNAINQWIVFKNYPLRIQLTSPRDHRWWVNSLSPGRCGSNFICEHMLQINFMSASEIALWLMISQHFSAKSLVSLGNKPLTEPMLTQIYVTK